MLDFLGKELTIGDKVVGVAHQRTSSILFYGEITRFTEKLVVVKLEAPENDWRLGHRIGEERKICPYNVVKI